MPDKTYYLVDLENVGLDGIHLEERLPPDDIIHIFSTVNGPKIDITTLAKLDRSSLAFHEVPPGKQSLDMRLVSFLGFLIKGDPLSHFVIISRDKDYDDVLSYWRAEGIAVQRREMLQDFGKPDKTGLRTKPVNDEGAGDRTREKAVRSFVDANFPGKKYKDSRDDIVKAVVNSKTRSQVNNNLVKLFPSSEMKAAYGRLKPLIKDLPGQ